LCQKSGWLAGAAYLSAPLFRSEKSNAQHKETQQRENENEKIKRIGQDELQNGFSPRLAIKALHRKKQVQGNSK
jgi:hypothetical protein